MGGVVNDAWRTLFDQAAVLFGREPHDFQFVVGIAALIVLALVVQGLASLLVRRAPAAATVTMALPASSADPPAAFESRDEEPAIAPFRPAARKAAVSAPRPRATPGPKRMRPPRPKVRLSGMPGSLVASGP